MSGAGDERGAVSGDEGLTIVELIVALVIVLIVFSVLASTLITSLASIRNNEARVRGVALANELVEEMSSVPWSQLGLSEADPDLTVDPSLAFEGEPVVVLTAAADPVLAHQETVPRGNRDYDIVRWITWTEEDGQPELKRMVAEVTWEVGGEASTIRSDGVRAPDAQDIADLEVDVAVEGSFGDGTVMPIAEDGQYPSSESIDVVAELGTDESSVVLRYRERDGSLRSVPGADAVAGPSTRTWTIPTNVLFRHGPTSFTVFATSEADGQIASDTATFRFVQDVDVLTPRVLQYGEEVDTTGETPTIDVNATGELCDPVSVEVDVEGMTSGEATPRPVIMDGEPTGDVEGGLTLDWDGNDTPVVMGLLQGQRYGGTFSGQVEAVFVPDPDVDTIITITVDADRGDALEEYGITGNADSASVQVLVRVVEGC